MILPILLGALLYVPPGAGQHWPEHRTIIAFSCHDSLLIDGKLTEEAWHTASWSDPFVDITGDTVLTPRFNTRVALLWNATHLYIGARLSEPHVWGTLLERDTVIYYDNDFEFFFDPDGDNHRYGEIEINALNTVWDLLLERPYRDGGPAVNAWDLDGLRTGVWIDGTVNDPSDRDRGWSIEIAIPWAAMADLDTRSMPPAPGAQWRINFSRVEWAVRESSGTYIKTDPRESNWVWSPMGLVNMHLPERWGVLEFRESGDDAPVVPDVAQERIRRYLMGAYAAQRAFRKESGRWALTPEDLEAFLEGPILPGTVVRPLKDGYQISVPYVDQRGDRRIAGVTNEGRLLWEERR